MNSDIWNDERITAYVFGELTDHDKSAFEAELQQNPSLARAVDEVKSLTSNLSEMFAAEHTPPLDPQRREQIAACASDKQVSPTSAAAVSGYDARRWIISLAASLLLIGSIGTFWWLGQQPPGGMTVAMQSPAATTSNAAFSDLTESSDNLTTAVNEKLELRTAPDAAMPESLSKQIAKDVPPASFSLPSDVAEPLAPEDQIAKAVSDQPAAPELPRMMKLSEPASPSELALDVKAEEAESLASPAPAAMAAAEPAPMSPARGLANASADLEMSVDAVSPWLGETRGSPSEKRMAASSLSDRDSSIASGLEASSEFQAVLMAPSSSVTRSVPFSGGKRAVEHLDDGTVIGLGGGGGGMGPGEGGDQFEPIIENDFRRVSEEPLSTFSIDVDTASFAKSRQYVMQLHRLPPAGAIRIEEWINYFEYSYEPPAKDDKCPFATRVEMAQCPWNSAHRVVSVGIKGKSLDTASLPASNLVFLIDTSGSMNQPNKLPLVKESLRNLVNELRGQDRVAIVVYAGAAGLVLDSTSASDKSKILRSINQMQSGGSTNGGEGVRLAYKIAREHFIKDGNNRVLLCSDGDFNVGTTSTDELVTMVETEAKGGIDLTVLGYGEGNFNDSMLEQISGRGNGNYAFIDNLEEANRVLIKQLAGTLYTIARDVKIQVDFNPKHVAAYRLIGYENRKLNNEDFKDDTKDAGEIGAGHCVTALYELIPAGAGTQEIAPEIDASKYQKTKEPASAVASNEALTVRLRYKLPGEDKSTAVEVPANQSSQSFESAGRDLRLATTVAGFGMTLRNSKHCGNWTLTNVLMEADKLAVEKSDAAIVQWVEMIKQARGLVVNER